MSAVVPMFADQERTGGLAPYLRLTGILIGPCFTTCAGGFSHVVQRWDGAIDGWRKTVLAFSNERIYIMQRDDPMHTLIPQLTDCSEVEIIVVARPMRSAEGMGTAAVGHGHRATSYTGVRGPEQPKGKGRRRERDRLTRPSARTRTCCAPYEIYSVRCTRRSPRR